jgi:hypothetical protein
LDGRQKNSKTILNRDKWYEVARDGGLMAGLLNTRKSLKPTTCYTKKRVYSEVREINTKTDP